MENITLTGWRARFWAWLIDVLLMGIIWYMVLAAQGMTALSLYGLGFYGLLLFLYWTLLEGFRGQSLGKMVLGIAVVGPVGERIGFKDAAIESFGKSFLLPLDFIVGILALRGKRQRLFNNLSDTVVARAEDGGWCAVRI
jgi:uncharacterized RDD family membrane protein YckC